MIFPMCKKNRCHIVVKYILENMLILTVFLVMGFACMESVWVSGNRIGNSDQDYCSTPISGTVAFTM